MNICIGCEVEMRCVKTGFTVRWGDTHCYRGDKYRCPRCGVEIVCCNTNSFQTQKAWPEEEFLQMPSTP